MAINPFDGPIPGMSLTTTPRNAPWENPPEIFDPKEALDKHVERLMDPDRMEAVLHLIEVEGLTIRTMVSGILRSAVANGVHSIDTSLIIAPALHEFIKKTADSVGVEYEEGLEDKEGKAKLKEGMALSRAKKMLKEAEAEVPKVSKEDIQKMSTEEAKESVDDFSEEKPSKGLMSRRAEQ
jgi:hypothetical protein